MIFQGVITMPKPNLVGESMFNGYVVTNVVNLA